MLPRNIILFLLITVGTSGVAFAQDIPDTNHTRVYKKIEDYSSKRKITSLLHEFLLKPVVSSDVPVQADQDNHIVDTYSRFEGKIIRNITITTLDPFGHSIFDTTLYPRSYLEKGGNALHIKTQHFAIRNQLLIHKYDLFDSLMVKESERLVRSQSYIHDVTITAILAGSASDSVDVFVATSDLWSIVADGGLSSERINLKLSDKNLAGLGHTFSYSFTENYQKRNYAFSTYYLVPNIRNTYISTRLAYSIDENKNYVKGINIERPFFSPVARWAGGILVSQSKLPGSIYINDTARSRYNIQDYWAAVAWQLFKGKSITDRTTKLILSTRMLNIRYLEKPVVQPDLMEYYTSEMFYLSGLGISSRKYVKQSYIFRFGVTEDVPVGLAYGLVAGYQLKNSDQWYWGMYHTWGNFFSWGYFGSKIEYGTFLNSGISSQSVFSASINYFSDLFSIGKWKFRQFIKPELTIGINRASYERLTLNDGYGINGFNSNELWGTRRILFIIQTQSYAPWDLLGFRFGPYLNCSFGMLGNQTTGFKKSRMYPEFGLGVLIRNDYLIFRNMQISIAFYPSIPGNDDNVFKVNPIRTTDFGFPDFVIGKPDVVQFH